MSPDLDIVEDRLSRIREKVGQIKSLTEKISPEEFKANFERHNAVLHLLQICIEACSDIASHICSYDNLGVPNTYAEAFEILADRKVISSSVAAELVEAVRFRNRIVHLYQVLDLEMVLLVARNKLESFTNFVREIVNYVGK